MERRNHTLGGEDGTPAAHDLTQIEGIGPKIASRLAASGVLTCADLAERPGDEIIKLLPDIGGLSPARVERWRTRAQELTTTTEPPTDSRPYESFLVRVLLDENGSIRSTTVQHVQSGQQERWAAWERAALLDFIENRVAPPPTQNPESPENPEIPENFANAPKSPTPQGTSQPDETTEAHRTDITAGLTLNLLDRQRLCADAGFMMEVTLDLGTAALRADRLAYHAVVVARQLATNARHSVTSAEGLIPVAAPTIRLMSQGLPAGIYGLEAAVSLREPGAAHPGGLAATDKFLTLEIPAN